MLAYGHQLSAEAAMPKALLQGGYVHCETERVKRRVTEFFFFWGGGGGELEAGVGYLDETLSRVFDNIFSKQAVNGEETKKLNHTSLSRLL